MLIDWFTVAAQVVNFLVLVWILKRFLYRRILTAIDSRESKIAARLSDAAAKAKEAEERLALHRGMLQEYEQRKESMLLQAKQEVNQRHADMIARALQEVRALQTRWENELDDEHDAFLVDLRRRAATGILDGTRRMVADLAGLDLQECVVKVFLEKLRLLDADIRSSFRSGDLLIRTTIDLSDEAKALIEHTLEERLGGPAVLRYERAPEIGLGIELRGNGWRVCWSSEAYLASVVEDLGRALQSVFESKAHAGVA